MEDSRIKLYDLKDGKSICQIEHPGSILQIEMPRSGNGNLYVLGYDELTVYHVEETAAAGIEAAAVRSLSLEPENTEYCGGFVLME